MSLQEYRKKEIRKFSGPWTDPDAIAVPAHRGVALATNVEYGDGFVETRRGYADVFSPANVVSSMFNWIYSDPAVGQKNYLLWWKASSPQQMRYADLSAPTPVLGYAENGAYAAHFVSSGRSVIIAQYGTDELARGPGRIFGFSGSGGAAITDALFQAPLGSGELIIVPSGSAPGVSTPGTHYVGIVMESRNGYLGHAAPASALGFVTTNNFSVVPGAESITLNVDPAGATVWPDWCVKVHLIATTAFNSAQFYFVPGQVFAPPVGTTNPLVFTFNIADDDLALNGQSAMGHMNLLASWGGTPPFLPLAVFESRNRIGYVFNDSQYGQGVFFSDENAHQAVSAFRSIVQLPGQRRVMNGFELRGVTYLLGPHWTYAVEDTGADPNRWPAPVLIDSTIGIIGPKAFAVNVSLGTAWVASKAGLYYFSGGRYDPLPVSYYNSDVWDRISWAQGYKVQVVDDAVNKIVRVLTALDGEIDPNHILTWDYSGGTTADKVNFSQHSFATSYKVNSHLMVQNNSTKRLEHWIAPGVIDRSFRRIRNSSDASIHRDGTNEIINTLYDTGLALAGKSSVQMSQHHGALFRLSGDGTLTGTLYGLDDTRSVVIGNITLAADPGQWYLRKCYLVAEDARWRFQTVLTLDTWFRLSGITHLWKPHSEKR